MKNKTIAVETNLGKIKVTPYAEPEMKIAFVEKVVTDSFLDDMNVYLTRTKVIFDVMFVYSFTDYQFPDTVKNEEGKVETGLAYKHIQDNNLEILYDNDEAEISLLRSELWDDIIQRIDYEKAKYAAMLSRNYEMEDTLVSLNSALNRALDFINNMALDMKGLTPDAMSNVINMVTGDTSENKRPE